VDRVSFGIYDSSLPPKSLTPKGKRFSRVAALRKCGELAAINGENATIGGYRAAIAAETAEHQAQLEAAKDRSEQTLRALLNDYCDHLKRLERRSHAEAKSIFNLHVFDPHPSIANTPAVYVTSEQIADMMRLLNDASKGRTANKLRSYIHAAYATAMRAKAKASIPAKFKRYGITSNPVAGTERDAEHDRADKNPLSESELRTYWQSIKKIEGLRGAALKLHLLTGGQRIEQLLRLKRQQLHDDYFIIFDGKGKPGQPPRQHAVPLIEEAQNAIETLRKATGQFVFSGDDGKTQLNGATLLGWAQAVDHGIADFQLKRLRSAVETTLAKLGVSREIRGELQSHGISGVQKRHYDAHDYMKEKRDALQRLFDAIEPPKQNKIVPIGRGKKAA